MIHHRRKDLQVLKDFLLRGHDFTKETVRKSCSQTDAKVLSDKIILRGCGARLVFLPSYLHRYKIPAGPMTDETVIAQTKKWITDVVVGCNFCPFAAREVRRGSIAFVVLQPGSVVKVLAALDAAIKRLDATPGIETLFLLLPHGFNRFSDYLKTVGHAEQLIEKRRREGVYQVASFHPQYLFAGSRTTDAANYTNRSPYPMLQLLREESVSRAVAGYPDTHKIPEKNTAFAREKGLAYMQGLLAASMQTDF